MAQGRSSKTISMIKWIRTRRLSIKNSLSAQKKWAWHPYTPDKSPLDDLPKSKHTWKGPGLATVNPLDQLDTTQHAWHPYVAV